MTHTRRTIATAACFVAAALAAAPRAASAALVLQSEFASYAIDAAGTKTAAVNLYLAQTNGTTTLTTGGGLNSAGIMVTTSATTGAPTLVTIAPNAAFETRQPSVANGTLYEERSNLSDGVAVDANRVFLGTFSYRYTGSTASPTTFTIADRPDLDGFYTASGQLLDASIASSTFAVTVPEPATLAALGGVALVALRRRRA